MVKHLLSFKTVICPLAVISCFVTMRVLASEDVKSLLSVEQETLASGESGSGKKCIQSFGYCDDGWEMNYVCTLGSQTAPECSKYCVKRCD